MNILVNYFNKNIVLLKKYRFWANIHGINQD